MTISQEERAMAGMYLNGQKCSQIYRSRAKLSFPRRSSKLNVWGLETIRGSSRSHNRAARRNHSDNTVPHKTILLSHICFARARNQRSRMRLNDREKERERKKDEENRRRTRQTRGEMEKGKKTKNEKDKTKERRGNADEAAVESNATKTRSSPWKTRRFLFRMAEAAAAQPSHPFCQRERERERALPRPNARFNFRVFTDSWPPRMFLPFYHGETCRRNLNSRGPGSRRDRVISFPAPTAKRSAKRELVSELLLQQLLRNSLFAPARKGN